MTDRSRLRLVVLQALVVSLLLTLLGRLWYVQIYSGAQYKAEANSSSVRSVVTESVRGQILDDEGRALVRNRTSLVVSIDRSTLDSMTNAQAKAVLVALAPKLKTTPAALSDLITLCGSPGAKKPPLCWNGSPFQPIPVAKDVTSDVALSILEDAQQFPGVSADLEPIREYPAPYKANAAQELGYIGPVSAEELAASKGSADPLYQYDQVGKAGLEAQYDQYLRGVNGVKTLSVDRSGNVTGTLSDTAAKPGDNVVLNIDARVQVTLEQQLAAAIQRARSLPDPKGPGNYKADSAAGVVMDVRNGHIIAMASLPTYDPSVWVGGIASKTYDALNNAKPSPLLGLAYREAMAPGSTFKVVSSSAMLQNGYTSAGPYACPSYLQVGTRKFTNAENIGHGNLTLQQAIEVSCDTVFYKVAFEQWLNDGGLKPIAKPKDIIINEAKGWGFGTKTGIDLPLEAASNVTSRADVLATYQQMRATYCTRAKTGYPEVAKTDPVKAATLKAYAIDNCRTGGQYKGGDAVNAIIGQGTTTATPLKMAQIYAAIANGGTLWTPQVAKAVLAPDGSVVKQFAPVAQGRLPISKATLAFLQTALRGVTTSGTSRNQFNTFPLNLVPVASKTGTAEVAGKQTTSWFTTYAPATTRPEYAIVMMVSQGGFGSTTSADSVRAIYEALFGIKGSNPPDPRLSILPGGVVPTKLPVITADGTILPPGSVLPPASPPVTPPASPTAAGALLPPFLSSARRVWAGDA